MTKFYCVVPNCKMRTFKATLEQRKLTSSEYLVSFHQFPPDTKRRKLWTKALGNDDWVPNSDDVVCSLHFSGDCYDESNKLLDSAVPTIVFDNFEDHLKLILDAILKEKCEEIDVSDSDEDQNTTSKELKASGEDEASGFSSSDSDFEIECEEILISGESDDDNNNDDDEDDDDEDDDDFGDSSIQSEPTTVATKSTIEASQASALDDVSVSPVICENVEEPAPKATNKSAYNIFTPSTKSTSVSSVSELLSNSFTKQDAVASKTSKLPTEDGVPSSKSDSTAKENSTASQQFAASNKEEPSIPKLHNIPTKNDTSEQARQLYSMIQSGSFQNFPVMQPASKNLVRQLLDIVKLANSRNQSSNGEESIPNTYIITTKYEDPNSTAKVKIVETGEVISMISQTVQAIKDGTYEKSEDLVIICGSPAIFLIKNVSVKSFDPNMNSVYVITTENLISYLYLLSTQAKQPRKIPVKTPQAEPISDSLAIPISSPSSLSMTVTKTAPKIQTVPFSSLVTNIVPQKPSPSIPLKNTPLTQTHPIAPTISKTTSQELARLIPAAPAFTPQNTSFPIVPSLGISSISFVAAENSPRVQSLPPSAVTTVSTPVILPRATNTSHSSVVTNIISSPVVNSNLLVTQSSSTPSVVIPSKSSAFQVPKVAIGPLNAMRNNMASVKRKMDTLSKPVMDSASRDDFVHSKSVPSLVLTQLPASSNVVTLPRVVNTTLNKTGMVKLTFAPALASSTPKTTPALASSTPKTTPVLKPLQPVQKTQPIRNEADKLNLKFDTTSMRIKATDYVAIHSSPTTSAKRKATDFVAVHSSPKRAAVEIEDDFTIENSSMFQPKVVVPDLQKAIIPIRTASPEAPSPIGEDNVGTDSEEERPLSPRGAQRLLTTQRSQIRTLEQNIIKKERDILALRKKIPALKKRCLAAKKTADSKPDEQLIEDILNKYLEDDAVKFFVGQMKVAGKTFTQFRWTEEDKLFALGLLYRNPVEYNVLLQRFTLPSDKTLNKFVARIKRAEMDTNEKS